ncbi:hypothetical protein [Kocuria sp. U4B]
MSLSPFSHHDLHPDTDTTVRVFPAIAPTPALPALRWWNHPLILLPATVILTVNLTHLPALPTATTPILLALSATLTTLGTCSYFAWDDSHHAAATEAAWITAQSGYHLHTHHDGHLTWTTPGTPPQTPPQAATLTPTPTGWTLTLTHHP